MTSSDGIEGLPRSDRIAGGDVDLLYGAALGQRDGGGFLGFGVAAALYGALDRGDLGHGGLDLALHRVLLGEKTVQENPAHRQRRQDDQGDDGISGLFPVSLLLSAGLLGCFGRRGGLYGRRLLLCHFSHVVFPPELLRILMLLYHAPPEA